MNSLFESYINYSKRKSNSNKKIKPEIGKYYELDSSFPYWCIDIQRRVIFESPLIIKFTHEVYDESGGFGEIVDIGKGGCGTDLQTKTEIEFNFNDIIKEYEFNNRGVLFWFEPIIGDENNNIKIKEK